MIATAPPPPRRRAALRRKLVPCALGALVALAGCGLELPDAPKARDGRDAASPAATLTDLVGGAGAPQGQARTVQKLGAAPRLDDAVVQAMADELLPEVAAVVGLTPLQQVTAMQLDRAGLRQVLLEEMAQASGTAAGQASATGASAAGLDDDQAAYLDRMQENVLGLYDPRSKRLMLVEGQSEADYVTTMRHELTHALQDQHFSLMTLQKEAAGALDRQLALTSVLEGQAMVAMAAQGEAPTLPGTAVDVGHGAGLVALLRGATSPQAAALLPRLSTGLQRAVHGFVAPAAPSALQAARGFDPFDDNAQLATMAFPYVGGRTFIQALTQLHTLPEVVQMTLQEPPRTTREIIHPEDYLAGEGGQALPLTALLRVPGHKVQGDTSFGELLCYLALGGGKAAARAAEGWRGDRVLGLSGFGPNEVTVWLSRWQSGLAATSFGQALVGRMEAQGGARGQGGAMVIDGEHVYVYRRGQTLAVLADPTGKALTRLRPALERDLLQLEPHGR